MMTGHNAPSLARATMSLAEAEADLMAVKRGSTVGESERLDKAIESIRLAAYEVRMVRDAREGLRW